MGYSQAQNKNEKPIKAYGDNAKIASRKQVEGYDYNNPKDRGTTPKPMAVNARPKVSKVNPYGKNASFKTGGGTFGSFTGNAG